MIVLWRTFIVVRQTCSSANSRGQCRDAASLLTASSLSAGTEELRAAGDKSRKMSAGGEEHTKHHIVTEACLMAGSVLYFQSHTVSDHEADFSQEISRLQIL